MKYDDYSWTCSGCGAKENQSGASVFCTKCANRPLRLSDERYLAALRRFRDLVASGQPLEGYDDNTTGNKSTEVNWGLCSYDPAQWPDPQDHLWPHSFTTQGRSAPLYRHEDQPCPFDHARDDDVKPNEVRNGCFWRCEFFGKPRKKLSQTLVTLDRDTILARYDQLIARVEARLTSQPT